MSEYEEHDVDGPSQEDVEPEQPALESTAQTQHIPGLGAPADTSSEVTTLFAAEPGLSAQRAADDSAFSGLQASSPHQPPPPEADDTTVFADLDSDQDLAQQNELAASAPPEPQVEWAPGQPAAPTAEPPHDPTAFAWPAAGQPAAPAAEPPHDPTAFAWPAPGQPAAPQSQPAPPATSGYPGAPFGSPPDGYLGAAAQPPPPGAQLWGGQPAGGDAGVPGQPPGGYGVPGQPPGGYGVPGQPPAGYAGAPAQPFGGYVAAGGPPQQTAYPPAQAPFPPAQAPQPPAGYPNALWQQAPPGYAAPAGGAPPYPYQPPQQWGQQQPGYGGPGMAPNTMWPGAQVPPKRRRGWRIALVAVTAAVVGAAGTGVVLYLNKGESPTKMALDAGRAIAPAKGLNLSGAVNDGNATFAVTEAGTVQGTYTELLTNQVTTITINGVTYIKAPAAFWTNQGVSGTAAGQANDKWAKSPASAVVMSFAPLTPGKIAGALEHVGNKPQVVYTTFHGTKVIKLSEQGIDYFITTSSPNRLVHVDGSAGNSSYSYNVMPLTAASIASVYATLHSEVQGLADAVDPQAAISPAQKIAFGSNCSAASSCTITGKVSVTDDAPEAVLVTMTVLFSAKDNGTPFASCHHTVVAHTPSKAIFTLACGVSGSTWSHWFNSHSGNFITWARADFVPAVNSTTDVKTLQSALDQEQGR